MQGWNHHGQRLPGERIGLAVVLVRIFEIGRVGLVYPLLGGPLTVGVKMTPTSIRIWCVTVTLSGRVGEHLTVAGREIVGGRLGGVTVILTP